MINACRTLSLVCYVLAATCAIAIVRDFVCLDTVGAANVVLAVCTIAACIGLARLWSLATRCEIAKAARS